MISVNYNTEAFGKAFCYRSDWVPADVAEPQRIATCMRRFAWSNIQWWRGERLQANFARALFIALDFDDGEMTLRQAIKTFCDSIHIIGTTKSHGVEKNGVVCDRFRVVLKLEDPVDDVATYRATMRHYIDCYGADPACKDGARFFWPCSDIVSVQDDGYVQEIIKPKSYEATHDKYALYRRYKYIPTWIRGLLKFGCPDYTRNTTCFKLGVHLTLCGYAETEIVDLIMASPIPVGPQVRREVEEAVRSGAKFVRTEVTVG